MREGRGEGRRGEGREKGERRERGRERGGRREGGRRERGGREREGRERGREGERREEERRVNVLKTHPPVSNIDDGDEKPHKFSHTWQPVRSRAVFMSRGCVEDFTRGKLRHSCTLIGGF